MLHSSAAKCHWVSLVDLIHFPPFTPAHLMLIQVNNNSAKKHNVINLYDWPRQLSSGVSYSIGNAAHVHPDNKRIFLVGAVHNAHGTQNPNWKKSKLLDIRNSVRLQPNQKSNQGLDQCCGKSVVAAARLPSSLLKCMHIYNCLLSNCGFFFQKELNIYCNLMKWNFWLIWLKNSLVSVKN